MAAGRAGSMKVDRIMQAIAKASNIVGAASLLIMLVVTVADVIMSKIFDWPFPGTSEVVISVMPISVFAFLLTTQMENRQISIDMVVGRLGFRARTAMKFLGQGIGIYLFGLLTWLNVPLARYSIKIGEHTGGTIAVPMYPAKVVISLACGLITIQLLIQFIRGLRALAIGRDPQAASIEAGPGN